MIEIVYNKEKEKVVTEEEPFRVPKNVRQIGESAKECKIYVEDYAYSYLNPAVADQEKDARMAVLLGRANWREGRLYLFVKSAVFIEQDPVTAEQIPMSDTAWGQVYEEMKQYFPEQEVVGWFLSISGCAMKITDAMYRMHLNHFAGNDKVLFLSEPQEQEEGFFLYHNGKLERQTGYYIYYERNEAMQEYMAGRKRKSVDGETAVPDKAVKTFRKIIAKKQEEKEQQGGGLLSAASFGMVVVTLALGIAFASRYMGLPSQLGITDQEIVASTDGAEAVSDNTSASQSMGELGTSSGADIQTDAGESTSGTEQLPTLSEVQPEEDKAENKGASGQEETTDSREEGTSEILTGATPTPTVNDGDTDTDNRANTNASTDIGENTTTTSGGNLSSYTIREGDTLNVISYRYYGTIGRVDEICKINDMTKEDIIYPGQTILLP